MEFTNKFHLLLATVSLQMLLIAIKISEEIQIKRQKIMIKLVGIEWIIESGEEMNKSNH